jgi:DNA polymerase
MKPEAKPDATSDAKPDVRPAATPRTASELLPAAAAIPTWLTALEVPIGLSAGELSSLQLDPAIAALPTLEAIAEMTRACTRCDLYRTAINPVPGEGNPAADFVCIGEAPGQNEDEQGRPFAGAAGALLDKILGAIQLTRDDVFICNVLKHRPPGNRDPLPEEVTACEPYLRRQLELVQPRVILALGRFAAQSLLQTTTPIGKLRGQIHRYHGIPVIVTYHPAALLRNEAWKRPTWDDVKLARRVLDAARAASA